MGPRLGLLILAITTRDSNNTTYHWRENTIFSMKPQKEERMREFMILGHKPHTEPLDDILGPGRTKGKYSIDVLIKVWNSQCFCLAAVWLVTVAGVTVVSTPNRWRISEGSSSQCLTWPSSSSGHQRWPWYDLARPLYISSLIISSDLRWSIKLTIRSIIKIWKQTTEKKKRG